MGSTNFTTDAVLSTLRKITLDDVNIIIKSLDPYEKVDFSRTSNIIDHTY